MIPRRALVVLVGSLIVLCVALGVLMSFQTLVASLGDDVGARVLRWAGVACLILLVIDLLLLVGALGLKALEDRRADADE